MSEHDDRNSDSVSVVSCSTRVSDATQDMDVPDIHRTTEKITCGGAIYRSVESNRVTRPWITDDGDMSPLVPIQSTPFTQKSPTLEDTASEMSELLIPVISNKSFTIINKSKFEIQESQQVEESQSLLPQVPADSSNSYIHIQSSYSREKDGWTSKHTDKMKTDVGNSKNNSSEGISVVTTSQTYNDVRLSQTTGISSQKYGNTFSQQMDLTRGSNEFTNSQPVVFASQEDVLTFSQVDNTLKNAGEIDSSQTAEILTQPKGKDPADRVISRLDRLVASLDNASRRQKMVIEATILQCITSLQDSLNNKLKKQQSTKDNAGIYRRLLQTSQTGLLKLTEQQKLEKIHLSQSVPHKTQKMSQSALNDFGKRQKRVFSLLKRQKYLVDLFKERKRLEVGTDHTATGKADQVSISKTDTKQISKIGNIQHHNNILGRNSPSKTHPITTLDRKSVLKKIHESHIEGSKQGRRDSEIVKASVELGKQVQSMRKSCKDSAKVYKDVYTEVNEVSGIASDNDTIRLEEFEECYPSQDLTTVPDTQDTITQDSAIGGNSPDNVDDITAAVFDNEMSEHSADTSDKLMTYETNSKMNEATRIDQFKAPTITDHDKPLNEVSLKRDIVSNVKTDENIQKSKLVDKGETMDVAVKHNQLKTSEVLWLNMVREDRQDKSEPGLSKKRILDGQNDKHKVLSKKLEKEKVNLDKNEAQQRIKEKSNFEFIKLSLTKKSNMFEVENELINSVNLKEYGNVSIEKTNKNKEQNDESAKGEVVDSNEKSGTAVGFSSPPNITLPGESWHNISPTATSMSSDVFMVKMKDIQKRMKRRVELSQNVEANKPLSGEQLDKPDSEVNMIKIKKSESFDKQIGNRAPEKDTISDAIDAVIKQSRDMSTGNDSFTQGIESNSKNRGHITSCESLSPRTNLLDRKISTKKVTNAVEAGNTKKPLFSGLPTLRELVQSGQLSPGKLLLSCFIKVLYKGRSLLSICLNSSHHFLPHKPPTNTTTVNTISENTTKLLTEQGTQVEDSEILDISPRMSDCEKKLNSLLSNCVVKLLTKQDFVSCDDLPENFWTEDFSKVRLHKDIWDTVDSW